MINGLRALADINRPTDMSVAEALALLTESREKNAKWLESFQELDPVLVLAIEYEFHRQLQNKYDEVLDFFKDLPHGLPAPRWAAMVLGCDEEMIDVLETAHDR